MFKNYNEFESNQKHKFKLSILHYWFDLELDKIKNNIIKSKEYFYKNIKKTIERKIAEEDLSGLSNILLIYKKGLIKEVEYNINKIKSMRTYRNILINKLYEKMNEIDSFKNLNEYITYDFYKDYNSIQNYFYGLLDKLIDMIIYVTIIIAQKSTDSKKLILNGISKFPNHPKFKYFPKMK